MPTHVQISFGYIENSGAIEHRFREELDKA